MVRASDLEEVGAGTGHYGPRGFESQGAKGKKRTPEPWAQAPGLVWGSGVALGAPLILTPTAAFTGLSWWLSCWPLGPSLPEATVPRLSGSDPTAEPASWPPPLLLA